MAFLSAGVSQSNAGLSELWPAGARHEDDFASLIEKVGSDVVGALDCASTAIHIGGGNDDDWFREWSVTGELSANRAKAAAGAGNFASARDNWKRAAIYFGAAEMYLSSRDKRRQQVIARMRACSRNYIEQLDPVGRVITIAGGIGAASEGYLVGNANPLAPVVICVGGWGDLKESYLPLIQPALDEGLSVLLVEAPSVRDLPGLGFDRFGTASYLIACVDCLEQIDGYEERSIVVYGIGAGASFASQAASLDSRIKFAVSDVDELGELAELSPLHSLPGAPRLAKGTGPCSKAEAMPARRSRARPERSTGDIWRWIAGRASR
ncbi:hypothetical protein [Tardiphaga sp.]|uniref:hypothetical protein n=1 Tax=Tardiphaga sp. TaxID=1926292 RepID=UPI0026384F52|nr:hypothetical protein [Tardiphaga sp.]MDB5620072.1 alpha/beta hydrolase [Tardiphaga sp.]